MKVVITKREKTWVRGTITGGFRFTAQVWDEGSEYGINEGRVSQLTIYAEKTDRWLVNYHRGWDIEPTAETQLVFGVLLAKLESLPVM